MHYQDGSSPPRPLRQILPYSAKCTDAKIVREITEPIIWAGAGHNDFVNGRAGCCASISAWRYRLRNRVWPALRSLNPRRRNQGSRRRSQHHASQRVSRDESGQIGRRRQGERRCDRRQLARIGRPEAGVALPVAGLLLALDLPSDAVPDGIAESYR